MKWTNLVCVSIFCIASIGIANAATSKHSHHYKGCKRASENTWFLGLGGGMDWIHLPGSTKVPNGSGATPPMGNDSFTVNNPKDGNVQFDAGYRWRNKSAFIPYSQLYLQYRKYMNTNIKGTIQQYSLPEFTNYNYKMGYSAQLYTLTGKLNLFDYKHLMPYFSLGVGAITNRLAGYSESALPGVTPRNSPDYNTSNNTAFATTLGAGLDIRLSKNSWATLGYEHVFQGKLETGRGQNGWGSTRIKFGRAKMDTAFLNLTFKFPDAFRSQA